MVTSLFLIGREGRSHHSCATTSLLLPGLFQCFLQSSCKINVPAASEHESGRDEHKSRQTNREGRGGNRHGGGVGVGGRGAHDFLSVAQLAQCSVLAERAAAQ